MSFVQSIQEEEKEWKGEPTHPYGWLGRPPVKCRVCEGPMGLGGYPQRQYCNGKIHKWVDDKGMPLVEFRKEICSRKKNTPITARNYTGKCLYCVINMKRESAIKMNEGRSMRLERQNNMKLRNAANNTKREVGGEYIVGNFRGKIYDACRTFATQLGTQQIEVYTVVRLKNRNVTLFAYPQKNCAELGEVILSAVDQYSRDQQKSESNLLDDFKEDVDNAFATLMRLQMKLEKALSRKRKRNSSMAQNIT